MTKNEKQPTRISAKDLGYLALPEACDRCFWIKEKCKPLPYQIFPGIFSSIDSYTKKAVHAAFDHYGNAPAWLPQLKSAYRYLEVPHWSKFIRKHKPTGIHLSGVPDDIFEKINNSLIIPDYKTAKFTKTQDELFPMYEVQLNGYAFIQDGLSKQKVTDLWLFYFQPMTLPSAEMFKPVYPSEAFDLKTEDFITAADIWPITKYREHGFDMQFEAHGIQVDVMPDLIDLYMEKAKNILDQVEPPAGRHDCKDCAKLSKMTKTIGYYLTFWPDAE